MRFGTFHLMGSPDMVPAQQRYDETLDLLVLAEELGFDVAWIAEHHFSNYGYLVNPLLVIAAASQRTSRIRFSQAVIVTPFWHPIRLAEDIAATDILTGGRLELGLGRGYQPLEFRGLGVSIDDSRSIFQEQIALMKRAWTGDDFTFEGRHFQIREPLTLLPKPLQQPHPPIWIAATSPASLEWTIEQGYHLLLAGTLSSWEDVSAWSKQFSRHRAEAGRTPDEARLGVLRHVYVCDSDEEAREAVWQSRWQIRVATHLRFDDQAIKAGRNDGAPVAGEVDDEAWWDRVVYGTPERCIAQLRRQADFGLTDFLGWFDVGGVPVEKVRRSMELFAREVMPAVAELGVG
jgi:alkanesulfonate monooxygenase SsuD/methylene tetrahydromethanopterin reductase-like flavin-dependent oxidoreductase (luciferase family)